MYDVHLGRAPSSGAQASEISSIELRNLDCRVLRVNARAARAKRH